MKSVRAHKVEQQKEARQPIKPQNRKPFTRNQPFNQGSSNPTSRPQNPSPSFPQRTPAPQKIQTPQNRPNPYTISNRRCFKCQGLGHIASDCPNHKVITLAEWSAMKEGFEEEEKKDDYEDELEKTQEEVVEEADEGELLLLRRVLSNQKGVKDEQRENILHSHCTVQGKVCSLIIDEAVQMWFL